MSNDPIVDSTAAASRRARLLGLKLRALVRDHLGDDDVPEAIDFPPGSGLVHGGTAWVLLDDKPAARLGAALAWATRAGADAVHVIAEAGSGVLARRAAEFTLPISVWHAAERMLLPAVAEPVMAPAAPPDDHLRFRELIAEAGAEPVVENGTVIGEVRGLEVCRVVDDPLSGEPRLDVGLGAHDREAFAMIHGAVPTTESLGRVVATVEQHRRPGAAPHPFNRLAGERLLRWRLLHEPGAVAAEWLEPADPPVARTNVKDAVPCVAVGRDLDGDPLVVVCSVGVDLDLIPFAADARLHAGGGRLVVYTPARDRVSITEQLNALLQSPAELVAAD